MKMDMENRLPGIGIRVCYEAKAASRNPAFSGNFRGNPVQVPNQGIISRQKIEGGDNMLPGDQKQVKRRHRI
jgi:hypothetical protein